MGMEAVNIDVSERTYRLLSALAADMGTTLEATVAVAVRRLAQHHMGRSLASRLDAEETKWLEADLS
jgi:hypothetical protein